MINALKLFGGLSGITPNGQVGDQLCAQKPPVVVLAQTQALHVRFLLLARKTASRHLFQRMVERVPVNGL